jgi:hypothetical protein
LVKVLKSQERMETRGNAIGTKSAAVIAAVIGVVRLNAATYHKPLLLSQKGG